MFVKINEWENSMHNYAKYITSKLNQDVHKVWWMFTVEKFPIVMFSSKYIWLRGFV